MNKTTTTDSREDLNKLSRAEHRLSAALKDLREKEVPKMIRKPVFFGRAGKLIDNPAYVQHMRHMSEIRDELYKTQDLIEFKNAQIERELNPPKPPLKNAGGLSQQGQRQAQMLRPAPADSRTDQVQNNNRSRQR